MLFKTVEEACDNRTLDTFVRCSVESSFNCTRQYFTISSLILIQTPQQLGIYPLETLLSIWFNVCTKFLWENPQKKSFPGISFELVISMYSNSQSSDKSRKVTVYKLLLLNVVSKISFWWKKYCRIKKFFEATSLVTFPGDIAIIVLFYLRWTLQPKPQLQSTQNILIFYYCIHFS